MSRGGSPDSRFHNATPNLQWEVGNFSEKTEAFLSLEFLHDSRCPVCQISCAFLSLFVYFFLGTCPLLFVCLYKSFPTFLVLIVFMFKTIYNNLFPWCFVSLLFSVLFLVVFLVLCVQRPYQKGHKWPLHFLSCHFAFFSFAITQCRPSVYESRHAVSVSARVYWAMLRRTCLCLTLDRFPLRCLTLCSRLIQALIHLLLLRVDHTETVRHQPLASLAWNFPVSFTLSLFLLSAYLLFQHVRKSRNRARTSNRKEKEIKKRKTQATKHHQTGQNTWARNTGSTTQACLTSVCASMYG